jgi:hypothetical protein
MIDLSKQMHGATQEAECKEHGAYISTYWTMPMPNGSISSWTGCHVCVGEHFRAKRGYGKPRYRFPHRPDYFMTTSINGIEETKEVLG